MVRAVGSRGATLTSAFSRLFVPAGSDVDLWLPRTKFLCAAAHTVLPVNGLRSAASAFQRDE